MRRIILGLMAVGLLGGALATALSVLSKLVQRDRTALIEQFSRERHIQLERATRSVVENLDDVSEDVRFAAELLGRGPPLRERKAELEALLASIGKYKAIAVFSADAQEVFTLRDSRFAASLHPYMPAIRAVAQSSLRGAPGVVVTSSSLDSDPSGWFRVFATAIDDEAGATIGVVAVLVDTAPLMTSLRALRNQDSRLLVMGARGHPLPLADLTLASAVARFDSMGASSLPGFSHVLEEMRAGHEGQLVLTADQAASTGLPAAESIALYLPMPVHGSAPWSVAVFTTTETLRSRDRSLVASLVLVAGVLAGFFALLGVSLTVTVRRDRELAETRRHATELGHARDVIQKILDHVPTGLMALSQQLAVTSVNRALRARIDPIRTGMSLRDFFASAPPFELERVVELVLQSRKEGRVTSLFADSLFGAEGHFRLASVPLAQPDDDLACLLVIDDLSIIRTLEEQLVRAEKLSTVGVLAAGIAHEIGTPLGIVRGRAEYLAGKFAEDSPHRSGLASIIGQIDGVSRVIRQLLDFSRLQPVSTTQVALEGAFESLKQLLAVEAEHRGVMLEVHAPGPLAVEADTDQLQQVLVNLIINAFDASSPGQSVHLSAEPVQGAVEFVVRDAGSGMTEDEQRRIFDPFWTTKKRGQGTGLGLAIVGQLVRNHGGTISISSRPSRGTTVRVTWPLQGNKERS